MEKVAADLHQLLLQQNLLVSLERLRLHQIKGRYERTETPVKDKKAICNFSIRNRSFRNKGYKGQLFKKLYCSNPRKLVKCTLKKLNL